MANLNLLVVITSVREGRVGEKVANWFVGEVNKDSRFNAQLVDLKELKLPYELPKTLPSQVHDSDYELEETRKWAKLVKDNDAVVFVSPEYNHSFSASLKNAVDHLYAEWNGKPVGFVNYGASGAPYSFASFWPVANWVKMDVAGPRVAISEVWSAFDDKGQIAHKDYREYEAKGLLSALVKKIEAK